MASVLTMEKLNYTLNNNSLNIFNNVSSNYSGGDELIIDEGEDPAWVLHIDRTKMVMTVIGLIANIGTTITLMVNRQAFSPVIRLLLTHQSNIDAATLFFAILLLVQPPNWIPGVKVIDSIICHVWQGQHLYWATVWISVWNLVIIALERYLAVCQPFKYANFTKSKVVLIFIWMYIMSIICSGGSSFQTYIKNGVCHSGYYWTGPLAKKMYSVFAISTFFTFYVIPVTCFLVLYGMVVMRMRHRKNNSDFQSNRVIDTAAAQLTKTAIAVTAIFIVTMGYDNCHYVLGYTGVLTYKMNSPFQKIGVFLAALNSVANPFVYAILMPSYRRSVFNTFCACFNRAKPDMTPQKSEGSHTTSTAFE